MVNELVSVILPAYNEGKVLRKNVESLRGTLEKALGEFEIIISEDGSTDTTLAIAKSLESDLVRVVHNGERCGKGAAIKNAVAHTRGNIIIFMDTDLATNPKNVKELVGLLQKGTAIVIGSRYHKDSLTKRTLTRYVASKGFNFLVRVLLGSRLHDHQCGFKAFRKDLLLPVINKVENENWFWDTELLIRAQRVGLKVAEIPIEWEETADSKFRLLRDTYHMGYSLMKFRLENL